MARVGVAEETVDALGGGSEGRRATAEREVLSRAAAEQSVRAAQLTRQVAREEAEVTALLHLLHRSRRAQQPADLEAFLLQPTGVLPGHHAGAAAEALAGALGDHPEARPVAVRRRDEWVQTLAAHTPTRHPASDRAPALQLPPQPLHRQHHEQPRMALAPATSGHQHAQRTDTSPRRMPAHGKAFAAAAPQDLPAAVNSVQASLAEFPGAGAGASCEGFAPVGSSVHERLAGRAARTAAVMADMVLSQRTVSSGSGGSSECEGGADGDLENEMRAIEERIMGRLSASPAPSPHGSGSGTGSYVEPAEGKPQNSQPPGEVLRAP